jgi:hypothetical protein
MIFVSVFVTVNICLFTFPGGAPLNSLIASKGVFSLSMGEWGWLRTEAAAWIIFTRAIAESNHILERAR